MMSRINLPPTLWLLLAIALGLRLLGAWFGNLTYDETAHLALADTIDFQPGQFHLVMRTLDHPLLSIYVLKLSGLVFGQSDFGLRLLHLLFGTATLIPVFLIGRHAFSRQAGLWAAALLAVDQFHASWSRLFMPEVLMLFFASWTLLQFLCLLQARRTRDFLLLGFWLGLAYLAKETGILMAPILWTFLLITRRYWSILRDWRWYLAHVVFAAVIAPDILWNLFHYYESYMHRDAHLLGQTFTIQWKPFSLYIGELFRIVVNKNVLDIDYEQANAYACYWPAGIVYLAAVVLTRSCWKTPAARLLAIAFGWVFVFFILLPGGTRFDPYWWASLSLIPAVLFAGQFLSQLAQRWQGLQWVFLVCVCFLAAHYTPIALRPGGPDGLGYRRVTVDELVDLALFHTERALERGDLERANERLIYALNVGGPRPAVYYDLGVIAVRRHDWDRAELFLQKSLKLAPDRNQTKWLLETVRSGKHMLELPENETRSTRGPVPAAKCKRFENRANGRCKL